ncbi:pyridoxamine 5'-phosphate oxidase family protein [Hasllibacter sp. MH4015]|uniref:pyridoxamine 5'-phosphate oxidase family protein n=1 Tax=Hasllibacter sp. MH4015 TaxID=2854029 RepID=UPI001CD4E78A|nr:pyridoxamine 5'-phosphate oxidase family protein [Hasllibacter sp. MH4015]
MSHHQSDHDTTALKDALFDGLENTRVGMLGLAGMPNHMQPMTHFVDREARKLHFITARDTDLAKNIGTGQEAHFCIMGDKGGIYACMRGQITPNADREKLEDLWSPAAAMWFDGGIDDPQVQLLTLSLVDAQVWTVDANALKFGLEMLRGTLGDKDPDLGDSGFVRLAA